MREKMNIITYPGETIMELLKDKNMSQDELALRTGYSSRYISEIISGKKDISSKFACALEYVFPIPMDYWISLQKLYDDFV